MGSRLFTDKRMGRIAETSDMITGKGDDRLSSSQDRVRNVVLVHGIGDTARVFQTMAGYLEREGFEIFVPNLKPNTGQSGLDDLAIQLKSKVERHLPAEERFDLVGFSMGGLVARYYIQRLNGGKRVRRLVTLSTPHHGSRLAYFLPTRGGRQMRPGSAFLSDLNRDLSYLSQVRPVSVWTPFDLMILPPESACLGKGTSCRIPVLLHPLMLRDRRVHAAVVDCLNE